MPLPAMKTARRCRARSKSTGVQCASPAAYGCATCRMHGARKRETIKSGPDHPMYVHGQATQEAKLVTREEGKELKNLKSIMKRAGLIK